MLQQKSVDSFVACIREGNRLYDSHPKCHGYLSCYKVISLWPEELRIEKEHRFTSKTHCCASLHEIVEELQGSNEGALEVGILTKSPFTICVVICAGWITLFDSHAHYAVHSSGRLGALVAVPHLAADAADGGFYVSEFFDRCLQSPFHQADFTIVELKEKADCAIKGESI